MLSPEQESTLAADILADPLLNAFPNTPDGAFAIAIEYNKLAVPNFFVWRSDVSTSEIKKVIIWTEYIQSTNAAERDALNILISNGIVNAADVNIRQAFADIFSGPQKQRTRDALIAVSIRLAKRIEKLFASGTGIQTDPATMSFEGTISFQDVLSARNP